MEGAGSAAKHTHNWEEWLRGPGGQRNALRARSSGAAKHTLPAPSTTPPSYECV